MVPDAAGLARGPVAGGGDGRGRREARRRVLADSYLFDAEARWRPDGEYLSQQRGVQPGSADGVEGPHEFWEAGFQEAVSRAEGWGAGWELYWGVGAGDGDGDGNGGGRRAAGEDACGRLFLWAECRGEGY